MSDNPIKVNIKIDNKYNSIWKRIKKMFTCG